MAGPGVLECSFLIPMRRDAHLSDGKAHPRWARNWLLRELYDRFQGGTLAPGLYRGFYTDPETLTRVEDESRRYFVAVTRPKLGELRELLSEACGVFKQKYIYLSVAGRVEFVEGFDEKVE